MKRLIVGVCLSMFTIIAFAQPDPNLVINIPPQTYAGQQFDLNTFTTTSSPGTLNWSQTAGPAGVVQFSGGQNHLMKLIGVGNVTITVVQDPSGPWAGDTKSCILIVSQATLTIGGSFTVNNRLYDGTPVATISGNSLSLVGKVSGDNVTLNPVAIFPDKNVGVGKLVILNGASSLSGSDASKYLLSFIGAPTTTASITAITLTIGGLFTANDKVYDGTTAATIASNLLTLNTVLGGDFVTLIAVATFNTKTVGVAKPVSLNGASITGADAGNYTLSLTGAPTTTANILSGIVTISGSFTVNNKIYDATTTTAIGTNSLSLNGVLGGDNVTLTTVANFTDKLVGNGKTVNLLSSYLSGTDAGKYTLDFTGAPTATANITKAPVTVTAQTDSRTYNALTSSSVVPIVEGIIAPDVIGTQPIQTYNTKHAATGKTLTPSGLVISDGNGGGNYNISYVNNTTGVITKATVTVTALTNTKAYDATTSSSVSPNVSGIIAPDAVGTAPIQTFNTRHAGTGKTLTPSGLVISDGNSGGNYNISYVNNTTGVINPMAITVTAQTDNRVYNATTSSSVIPSISPSLAGTDTPSFIQKYFDEIVGTGKTLTPSGSVNDGNSGNNYTVTFITNTTGVITPKTLTIGGTFTVNNKPYDGNVSATIATNNLTLITVESGDVVTLNPVAQFNNKNRGTNKPVNLVAATSLSGTDASNYVISLVGAPATTASITNAVANLTIGGSFTASDKVYDALTNANISSNSLTLIGIVSGDIVTLNAVATFADKHAGTGKIVSLTSSTLSGADAGNYNLSYTGAPTATANITKAPATVTAQTVTKVYDGGTSSSVLPLVSGYIAPDVVGTAPIQTFDTKHVGTGKTVTPSGLVINDGNSGNNYNISYVTVNTGVITVKSITVTAVTDNRVYNAITSSSVTPSISPSLVGSDTPSFIQTFDNKNVGTGKTLTASGSVSDGNSGNNYSVTFVTTTTGVITKATVTVTAQTDTRIYNTLTSSSVVPVVTGIIAPDVIGTQPIQAFTTKHAGTGKTLTPSGLVISDGNSGGNYNISYVNNTTGVINKAPVTVTALTDTKTYDTTTSSSVSPNVSGIIAPDVVGTAPIQAYNTKHAGTGKTLTPSGLVISDGNSGGNYNISYVNNTTGVINPKSITVTALTDTRVYNRTISSSVTPSVSPSIAGSDTPSFIQTFDNKNVGTGKTLTPSGSVNDGNSGSNYLVTFVNNTTGVISPVSLTIGGSFTVPASKVYDGSTSATITTNSLSLIGIISGDVVTLTAVANYDNKNVGTGKTVNLLASTLAGVDAGNYTLSFVGAPTTTAAITPPPHPLRILGSFTVALTKVYDGTTNTSNLISSLSLDSVRSGDVVFLVPVAKYADKNIGLTKTVNLLSSTLGGADAANYTLDFTGAPVTAADITPLTVTIGGSFIASNKVYDATVNAGIATDNLTIVTKAGSDNLTLSAVAKFDDKNVGVVKNVSLNSSTLAGTDAGNYLLSYFGAPTSTANITKANITAAGNTALNKTYDGTTTATLGGTPTVTPLLTDIVIAGGTPSGTFANKNAGTGKAVTVTGVTISGADEPNYNLLQQTGLTANIIPKQLTIGGSFTASNKVYNADTLAVITSNSLTLSSKVGTDVVTLSAIAYFTSKTVGTGKPVRLTSSTLSGTDAANYTLSFTGAPVASADITAKPLTISGVTAKNKTYDGTTSDTLSFTGASLSGIIGTEIVSPRTTGYSADFNTKDIGTSKPVTVTGLGLTGADSANYTLTQPTGLTASIIVKTIEVKNITANKVYDCTITAYLDASGNILVGVVPGEDVWLNNSSYIAKFNTNSVGTGKPVTVTGLFLDGKDNGNYTLTQPAIIADINPRPLTATVNSVTKKYGDPLPAFTFTYTGFASCDNAGSITTAPTVTTTASQFSDVGTYALVPSNGFSPNYVFTYVNGTLTINKATLTATATNKSRTYGDNNPTLDITYTGFNGTDTKSVIDVEPTIATTALKTSNAGTYPITLTGGSDNNYTFNLVTGTLTINKAPLRIYIHNMRKFTGDAMPASMVAYIYKSSDFKFTGDNATLDFSLNLVATCSASSVPGTYQIDFPATPVDNNYAVTDTSFNTPYKKGSFYVHPKLAITTTPTSQKACENLGVTFSTVASGVFQKYFWLLRKTSTGSFDAITTSDNLTHRGDSTNTLIVNPIINTYNGYQFICTIVSKFYEDSLATVKVIRKDSISTSSNIATLTVDKSPPLATIIKKGNILICTNDSAKTWAWGDANGAISGQTKQTFMPTGTDPSKYWVKTTNANGCTTTVNFGQSGTIIPIKPVIAAITITPNPNDGNFEVTVTGLTANVTIQIFVRDYNGKTYFSGTRKITSGNVLIFKSSEISSSKLKPGIYFIDFTQDTKRAIGKIIVNSN